MARRVIINADDLGVHPGTDAGILDAYTQGVLTSATLLMTTPWMQQALHRAKIVGLPLGVHLSLTLGKSRAGAAAAPDLVDHQGNLHRSAADILLTCNRRDGLTRLLPQIKVEFEAQLAAAADCGIAPTHLDSHQHVHMHPAIYALVQALAPRFGVHHIRFAREKLYAFELGGDLPATIGRNNHVKWLLLAWLARRIERRLKTPDEFFAVKYSGVMTKRALLGVIRASRAETLEIGIHPGRKVDPGDTGYEQPNYIRFISSPWRQRELDALCGHSLPDELKALGITLCDHQGRSKA
ncbi:MAG: ChbG/HpnK family deacetylase [Hyphomicrobiales bacterium]|nr:ChbG/HpnK family deacetylase [Hyphomicrobiales bacterium]